VFVVASQGLLPVILSSIKHCDSQQGNSVSSTVKCSKAACVGDNSIGSNRPGSLPAFCTVCDKKLGSLAVITGSYGSKTWVQHFPSMPTKRTFAAVLCTETALIVAGGKSGIYAHVATIEVMDTESPEWSTVDSLPIPLYQTSITVCGDDLYFAGGITEGEKGANSVFTCSLSALLKPKQQSQSFTMWLKRALYVSTSEETEWSSAASLPVYWSTCTAFGGQLVAVGGRGDGNKYSAAIYAYNPTVDEWDFLELNFNSFGRHV